MAAKTNTQGMSPSPERPQEHEDEERAIVKGAGHVGAAILFVAVLTRQGQPQPSVGVGEGDEGR